jgi:hypothetical protein
MTSHSEITMFKKPKTPQQLESARARAAHAREVRMENARKRRELKMPKTEVAIKEKRKYKKKQDNAKVFFDNFEAYKALNAKIASLEHQAIQYRTVIDYLESKVDSLLLRK